MEENKKRNVTGIVIGILLFIIAGLSIFVLVLLFKDKGYNTNEVIKEQSNKNTIEQVSTNNKKETISSEQALLIGKEKYKKAEEYYSGIKDLGESIKVGVGEAKKVLCINDIKELFSKNKFDKFIGKITDESENFNNLLEKDGEYYRTDSAAGGVQSYLYTDDLTIKSIDENKIIFEVKSYYLVNDEPYLSNIDPKEYVKTAAKDKIETKANEFIIIKENGNWKVDYYVLPF